MSAKLTKLGKLAETEVAALRALPCRVSNVAATATLVREGQPITECCLLVSGYACRNKLTRDGTRQIVSFHVAGDILDIQHLLFERADHNVQMITPGVVAFFEMERLRRLVQDHPAIGQALWRDCLIDASVFREWVLNVGRRDAIARVAHMLCEFLVRQEQAGISPPENSMLPMTQEHIADATGLTSVHVNRTLRKLREQCVIAGKGREFRVVDWSAMQRIADFNPAYLHIAA
jgi:CRP-like cAMP-binding protein